MALSRQQVTTSVGALIQKEVPSETFGGELLLREMTRKAYRQVIDTSAGDVDKWNAGLFAAMVIDPVTDKPMFTTDEVLEWANRSSIWVEILRLAQVGLDLSEVGKENLKSESAIADDR
jgi:hypothetical protein